MQGSSFTEEQITCALVQAELRTKIDEICRKLGISDATFSSSARSTAGTIFKSVGFAALDLIAADEVWRAYEKQGLAIE